MAMFFFDMKDGVPMRDRVGTDFASNADAITVECWQNFFSNIV
jgi:hypothetical protein